MSIIEPSPAAQIRARIKADLLQAMKARHNETVSALRVALAAIDNAEAVALPADAPAFDMDLLYAIADSRENRDGPATAQPIDGKDVPRRELTAEQIREIIAREVDECQAALAEYERSGRVEEAERMRAAAAVIAAYLE